MKKRIVLLASALIFLGINSSNAQDECVVKYNLFKGDYQSKKNDDAYPNLIYLLDNCASLSLSTYIYGERLVEARFKEGKNKEADAKLMERIYKQRLENFPDKDAAKAHSDYATFLVDNNLASDSDIFPYLEKAYKIDPTRLGVKNIYRYFQGITDRNKDTNPQLVFDTYDDVLEAVNDKLDDYSKKITALNQKVDKGSELDKRESRNLYAYTVNSKALGLVEGGLDNIIVELSTCERLIPLYTRDFEKNSTNAEWLKRAASRMYNKECTDDPLYDKLVEALVKANPSPEASVFYAGILYKKGKINDAMNYYQQAVDLEPDDFKKAKNLLKIAQLFSKKGQKSEAVKYANQALKFNPGLGKAYLLIASSYASSADACGSSEFEKRMVYVAALNKARRAKVVDPSISEVANKYIANYESNIPNKKLIFTEGLKSGSPYTIKCWIGETVKIPEGK